MHVESLRCSRFGQMRVTAYAFRRWSKRLGDYFFMNCYNLGEGNLICSDVCQICSWRTPFVTPFGAGVTAKALTLLDILNSAKQINTFSSFLRDLALGSRLSVPE